MRSDDLSCGLSLSGYAAAIDLFAPAPAGRGLAALDRRSAIETLVRILAAEQAPGTLPAGEPRAALRALLTVRPPQPVPDGVAGLVDDVLASERRERGHTDAAGLRVAFAVGGADIVLWRGDITNLSIDAIVNAANSAMLGCFVPGHACIDNAIHNAAGPRLRDDCATIMSLQGHDERTGCAKITRGYALPSRFVLHTVGPIVHGPLEPAHAIALARCYTSCLEVALTTGQVRSIAFCCISTGVFGYPKVEAAAVAVSAVMDWLREHPGTMDRLVFNVFSEDDHAIYAALLNRPEGGQA